jgi:hypothetical protein
VTAPARRRAWLAAAPPSGALVLALLALRQHGATEPPAAPVSLASPTLEASPGPAPNERVNARTEAARAPSVTPAAPPEPDEAELMSALRGARQSDPGFVVALAREGNRRFPSSADAPERTSLLIHALAEQGLASEARGEAEDMVNRYPDTRWVREVEAFTGAHRHRNLELDEAGRLRYVDPPPPS